MFETLIITSPPMAEPITATEAKLHLRVDGSADDTLIGSLITAARKYCELFQSRTYMATTYQVKIDSFGGDRIYLPSAPLWSVDSITYVDSGGTTQTLSTSVYSVDTNSEPGVIYLEYQQVWPATRGTYHDITINFNAGYRCTFAATDLANNVCTAYGRSFTNGQRVRLYNSGGALPTGLSADTDYYVVNASGTTFKLSATSGGVAIDITAAGTGTHYVGDIPATYIAAMKLLISHWYENRETVNIGNIASELPFTVKNLLWQDRIMSF